jgi:hypothetical protein
MITIGFPIIWVPDRNGQEAIPLLNPVGFYLVSLLQVDEETIIFIIRSPYTLRWGNDPYNKGYLYL